MEFAWLNDSRTSNKEIAPPRSPRLPAPRKVSRICGKLTTPLAKSSHINRGMWASSGSGGGAGGLADVAVGSWLCKNAKTLNRDRRSYSSKTALVAQLASELNLEVELKNIILVALRFFEFLHSQGQFQKSAL
jgi:hypothetical protein